MQFGNYLLPDSLDRMHTLEITLAPPLVHPPEIISAHAQTRIVSAIRASKFEYFQRLHTANTKTFWKMVKQLSNNHASIPSLNLNEETVTDDSINIKPIFLMLLSSEDQSLTRSTVKNEQ